MRVHDLAPDGDAVAVQELAAEAAPLLEMEGAALEGVRLWQHATPWGRIELVELAVGGELPLHSGDQVAVCQVVRGRGRVGLPDGSDVPFEAPQLLVFQPGAVHSWHDVQEPVLLSICVVGAPG